MNNGLFNKFERKINSVRVPERRSEENSFGKFRKEDLYKDTYLPEEDYKLKDSNDYYDEVNLYPSQKPESFHFYILDNQFRDLERLIRGVKDVYDKEKKKWVIKRKDRHCFTDEESEEIIRTAQSHLSPDIKLAIFSREEYPILLNSIFDQLYILFKEIMDYRFGRFGDGTTQFKMKQQAVNIFQALMMRIKANYSRAIEGRENKATHDSVKGQESLQNTEKRSTDYGSYT